MRGNKHNNIHVYMCIQIKTVYISFVSVIKALGVPIYIINEIYRNIDVAKVEICLRQYMDWKLLSYVHGNM